MKTNCYRSAATLRLLMTFILLLTPAVSAHAQGGFAEADRLSEAVFVDPPPPLEPLEPIEFEPPRASAELIEMAWPSRWLLAPIVLLSIIVVAVAIERLLGLRQSRVAPRRLERQLREQITRGIDPAAARAACENHPSAASRVVMAMLGKVGRPHPEVEAAANDEIDRQADRLYANVRTLNLAAAVAPLMGLLGTVWGMIQAFFVTARLPIEANKGQELAEGIYTALFTTFAGLAVAIPAAVLAHLFEGRILRLMRRVETLVAELLPSLERFEGDRRAAEAVKAPAAEAWSKPHAGAAELSPPHAPPALHPHPPAAHS